jgi:hypothetical protein
MSSERALGRAVLGRVHRFRLNRHARAQCEQVFHDRGQLS